MICRGCHGILIGEHEIDRGFCEKCEEQLRLQAKRPWSIGELMGLAIGIISGDEKANRIEKILAEIDQPTYRRLKMFLIGHRHGKMIGRR